MNATFIPALGPHGGVQVAIALLALFLFAGPLLAQRVTGSLLGTVVDPSGAPVAGAAVRARNTQTGIVKEGQTDPRGFYQLLYLPPGQYDLTLEAPGFKKVERKGLQLIVDQDVRIDVNLELGALTESVTVSGEAPVVTSESAALGQVFGGEKLVDMPLFGLMGRSALAASRLLPGMVEERPDKTGAWHLNGQRDRSTNFTTDGGLVSDASMASFEPTLGTKIGLDTIAEFKIDTGSYNAELGGGSTAASIITKSGTNTIHGSLYEYFGNDKLNARSFFAPSTSKIVHRYNQFGGTIGGPVIKNRLFYFFGYEGRRQLDVNFGYGASHGVFGRFVTVPTEKAKQGDFSEFLPLGTLIYDPNTTRPNPSGSGFVRSPFAENRIPENRMDPIARKVLPYFESANLPGVDGNYVSTLAAADRHNMYQARGDYQVSNRNSVFVSTRFIRGFSYSPFLRRSPDPWQYKSPNEVNDAKAAWNYTVSPTLLNELRGSWYRVAIIQPGSTQGGGWPAKLGLTTNAVYDYFPSFSMGGTAMSTSLADGSCCGSYVRQTPQLANNTTWIRGRHTIKAGIDMRFLRANDLGFSGAAGGSYVFSGVFTQESDAAAKRVGFADFLLGWVSGYSANLADTRFGNRKHTYMFYGQDTFKITPSLTLNFGIRWESDLAPFEAYDRKVNFDPGATNPATGTKGAIAVAGRSGASRGLYNSDLNNWAPRLGIAWSPHRKFSVRSAYGVFHHVMALAESTWASPPGFVSSRSWSTTDQKTPVFVLKEGAPLVPLKGEVTADTLNNQGIQWWPQELHRTAYYQEWNLTLERELPHGILVRSSYIGNKGTHLYFPRPFNFVPQQLLGPGDARARTPFPQYLGITGQFFDGSSIYHGWQNYIEKRTGRDFYFTFAYTHAKCINDYDYGYFPQPGNLNNLRAERGSCEYDVPHLISTSYVYEVPFGRGKSFFTSGVLSHVIGGWEVSGVWYHRSGLPFSLWMTNPNNDLGTGQIWPNRIRSGKLDSPTIDRWYDVSAFTVPAPYTYGNAGKAVLRGPRMTNVDLALLKNTRFKTPLNENTNVQFRAEFFNLPNHTSFAFPMQDIQNPRAGQIQSTFSYPRKIQFGLRLEF